MNRSVKTSAVVAVSLISAIIASASCSRRTQAASSYLCLWAGDADGKASDFLAVIDATAVSPRYGSIVASIPTGTAGAHPHHTELEMPANGHLLANGFSAGRTWLFDLTQPTRPQVITSFGDLAGFSHPHTFIRLPNGNLLTTLQYAARTGAPAVQTLHAHGGAAIVAAADAEEARTGGLVEMDERGTVIRSRSAHDPAINDSRLYPYSVLPIPAIDRAVLTTTDMNEKHKEATSQWVQFWRLSDLSLLKSVALPPGPRGDEHHFTGEPKLLPDGHSVYVHTFNCGLYLIRDVDRPQPSATFVKGFPGKYCGVPVLTSHYWLQTVPHTHALVALDIADPEHPREVSQVTFGDDEEPHWLAIDPSGRRLVMNSAGYTKSNRLFVINFDPTIGALSIDDRFRDSDSTRPGIDLTSKSWPHGFSGKPVPHGTVFSR
jgi:hypothetical protein